MWEQRPHQRGLRTLHFKNNLTNKNLVAKLNNNRLLIAAAFERGAERPFDLLSWRLGHLCPDLGEYHRVH